MSDADPFSDHDEDAEEPILDYVYPIHSIQLFQNSDGVWLIRDTESNVATQGDTKYEALLMLADALAAYDDADIDLLESAEDIFVLDDEQREFLDSLEQE